MSSLTRKSLVHGSHYSLFNFSFLYFWKVNDLCVNVCWINKCWLQFVAPDSVQYKVPFPVVLNSTVVVLFSTVVGLKTVDLCSLCNYCWDSRFHKATNHDVLTLYGSYAPERSTSLCRRGLCDSTCVIHTFHTFRQEPSMSATYSRTWLKAVEVILRVSSRNSALCFDHFMSWKLKGEQGDGTVTRFTIICIRLDVWNDDSLTVCVCGDTRQSVVREINQCIILVRVQMFPSSNLHYPPVVSSSTPLHSGLRPVSSGENNTEMVLFRI